MILDYTRQHDLINVLDFNDRINVIGCGALGSWLAFFLLKMGFMDVHVYDFDVVEEHNIPNQLFQESQINMKKTDALYGLYGLSFDDISDRLTIHDITIDESNASSLTGVVFSCVDSMKARKSIYENCFKYGQATTWIEGRIGLFGAYVYSLDTKNSEVTDQYEATLYSDDDAEVSSCGVSQTALPAAVNCASIMLMQLISKFRGNVLLNKIEYSIPDLTSMSASW